MVDGVGAFIYLGTVAGTAADYEPFSNKYSKDIILRSPNTSSSIKFLDNLTVDDLGFFMRYNAANNFFEIGSNDGVEDIIVVKIDRGKADWEFQDRIQILKPGRGVNFLTPSATNLDGNSSANKYELRINEGGVIELWNLDVIGDLDALLWSSESGLDLRASNLAADLSTAEKDGIKNKIGIYERQIKEITTNPYTIIESDEDKHLISSILDPFLVLKIPNDTFTKDVDLVLSSYAGFSFDETTGNYTFLAPLQSRKEVDILGTIEIKVFSGSNQGYLTGDLLGEGVVNDGSLLNLYAINGTNYNYTGTKNYTSYTTFKPVVNGLANVLINAASEPVVYLPDGTTLATKIAGATFVSNTDMEMIVESRDGINVRYYFKLI